MHVNLDTDLGVFDGRSSPVAQLEPDGVFARTTCPGL
jgi:hypothetical protein